MPTTSSNAHNFNEPFLDLTDTRWQQLEGGYHGTTYDASAALQALQDADTTEEADEIYLELWDELHHQGDVGLASYYAVPHLVRIAKQTQLATASMLGLVVTIEVQRHQNNPPLPNALTPAYHQAIQDAGTLARETVDMNPEFDYTSAALAAIALANDQLKLAHAILNLDSEDVIDEFLESY